MSKKKADHATDNLIERMLSRLEERRERGDGAYPPTLEELATLCEIPPTSPQLAKAAKNKAFTTRAVVASKGKLLPEAPVVLTDHAADESVVSALLAFARKGAPAGRDGESSTIPKLGDWLATPLHKPFKEGVARLIASGKLPSEFAVLAERMIRVLQSQRRLGDGSYPPTFEKLAILCGSRHSDAILNKAVKDKVFAERAVVAGKGAKVLPPAAPVLLRADIEDEAVVPALLDYAMTLAADPKKKTITRAFTVAELSKSLTSAVEGPFKTALDRSIEEESLPGKFAWVVIKNKPHLFAIDHMGPASRRQALAARPALVNEAGDEGPATISMTTELRDFGTAFREAFESLDRRNGKTNFVKLADLRRVLSDFDRHLFDAGLNRLRDADEFGLDSHEGLHGTLTPEEREAGMREAGSLLVYVSRR